MIFKTCDSCAKDRAEGNLAEAVTCPACKGKGIVRTRESWVCNGCGECLCPDEPESMNGQVPYGLVETVVEGGYSSPHLSDTTTYKFSLCEACLRKLFDTFKIPPMVGEYYLGSQGGEENTEPYAEERDARQRAFERNKADEEEESRFVKENRCTERPRLDDGGIGPRCGEPAVMRATYEGFAYPRCVTHGRDCYVRSHMNLLVDGREISPEKRAEIGRRYLVTFAKMESGVQDRDRLLPADEAEAAIFISTLLTLVARRETCVLAHRELLRITMSQPERVTEWVGYQVPLAFTPKDVDLATTANSWLAWGKKEGYVNAVAHALLGYDAASLWKNS